MIVLGGHSGWLLGREAAGRRCGGATSRSRGGVIDTPATPPRRF